MSEDAELYTVGEVARRTGLSAHTIRFWSDNGLVSPAERSQGGYRLYDASAVARFDLIRTLRDLGIGLESVREILERQVTVAEVAETHARALDAEIRALKLRRAVLRGIAKRGGTTEETVVMHKVAQQCARERQKVIDDFVETTFAGIELDEDARVIAAWMLELPGELPEDPSPDQVDAWIELAEVVADEGFRQRLRGIALAGGSPVPMRYGYDLRSLIVEQAGAALAGRIAPDSAEGKAVLDRIVFLGMPAEVRGELLDWMEIVADARVERYWELVAVLNGHAPSPPAVPSFRWTLDAVHAHG
ncbi:MerR family transcriptional regulator [Rhizohabitans arisaemae]|uniref:helix-turn-helix domain-containing protein n=1 Tax=Rhizohabitans arisaemae TaxID=2720610 RepID=UPI0024B0BB64|nr:MerR family transcriptional regulator [Rhizohabitans arisaemae]